MDGYDEDLQGFSSEAHDNAWLELVTRKSSDTMRIRNAKFLQLESGSPSCLVCRDETRALGS